MIRLLVCLVASLAMSNVAIAAPARVSRGAAPFECATQFAELGRVLHRYQRVDLGSPDDEEDVIAAGYAADGVRVFGFNADQLDVFISNGNIELTTYVRASYDDVMRAAGRRADNGGFARVGLPRLSIEPAEEDGFTIISCVYERGPTI